MPLEQELVTERGFFGFESRRKELSKASDSPEAWVADFGTVLDKALKHSGAWWLLELALISDWLIFMR